MRRKRRTMRRIGKIIGERFYDKQLVRGGGRSTHKTSYQ